MSRRKNQNRRKPIPKKSKPKSNITHIEYTEGITVNELADKLEKNSSDIIKLLFMMGTVVNINTSLDNDTVELICLEYGVEAELVEPVDELSLETLVEDRRIKGACTDYYHYGSC